MIKNITLGKPLSSQVTVKCKVALASSSNDRILLLYYLFFYNFLVKSATANQN